MKEEWRIFAKCRGMDVDVFFPDRGVATRLVPIAKKVCDQCPVKRPCLELALGMYPDNFGVFGGTTSVDRRYIRRQLKRDPEYLDSVDAKERYGLGHVHQRS